MVRNKKQQDLGEGKVKRDPPSKSQMKEGSQAQKDGFRYDYDDSSDL